MMVGQENEVRSLDRIIEQNQGENSLLPKRQPVYAVVNQALQDGSKNAQRRLKSPKNSNINAQSTKGQ